MNSLDDFLSEYGEKVAVDWKGMGQQTGNALLGAAAVGAGTMAIGGLGMAASHIYDAATAKRDFRGMMEWNQDLHHEDQRMVNQSFKTLRHFAPDMSKDPLVAGSMIRQMVQAPQGAAGIMSQALQAQKNIGSGIGAAALGGVGKGMQSGMNGFQPLGAGGRHAEELAAMTEAHNADRQAEQEARTKYGPGRRR